MAKKVLVAMSGGVDSSVAAYLLQEQGYEVTGATLRTWAPNDCDEKNTNACCGTRGVSDARSVAMALGVPYYVLNFENDFKRDVIDYFVEEYKAGRTPNPCIACNEKIKVGGFWKRAKSLGFDYMATGHYARVGHDTNSGRYFIRRGLDSHKDQSYVLFPQQQEELEHLLLPVGELQKEEVRRLAQRAGLSVYAKPDSQEICFIPENDYAGFMEKHFELKGKPGAIKNSSGETIGTHSGYFRYTIGQRRGLGVAHKNALYVIAIRPSANEVIVGDKSEVSTQAFAVSPLHWHQAPRTGRFRAEVKIRSAHPPSGAEIVCDAQGHEVPECARVLFDVPQEAVTPGQAAVFYEGDAVIAGGWIRS
ncbi:MAG: tRNA 2-thiouridine(34) synthase MnmA [Candidatus Omnitrophica bacterium]|nr:tRNA 2-thiouridine(34) synthase MnmA [Candidatus Omnitrophota bacterium]